MIEQLFETGYRKENDKLYTMETILEILNEEKEGGEEENNEKENDRVGCIETLSEKLIDLEASNEIGLKQRTINDMSTKEIKILNIEGKEKTCKKEVLISQF